MAWFYETPNSKKIGLAEIIQSDFKIFLRLNHRPPVPEALMSILGSGAVVEHVGAVLVSGTPQQAVFQQ